MITIHEESTVHFFHGCEGHLEIHHSSNPNRMVVIVIEDSLGRRLKAELSSEMREALGHVLMRSDKENR